MAVHIAFRVHLNDLWIQGSLYGIYALLVITFLDDIGSGCIFIYNKCGDVLSL